MTKNVSARMTKSSLNSTPGSDNNQSEDIIGEFSARNQKSGWNRTDVPELVASLKNADITPCSNHVLDMASGDHGF